MPNPPHVFSVSELLALARDPDIDLARDRRVGEGFSFPQRGWLYAAAGGFYQGRRTAEAMTDALRAALVRGRGMTAWKQSVEREMQPLLESFRNLHRTARGDFEHSAFQSPPIMVAWRNHGLRLPLGLLCRDGKDRFIRLLWIERGLQSGRRGVTMVVAATLAAAEEAIGPLAAVETWHLRDNEARFYHADDLHASFPKLDRMLTAAEARLHRSPAA